jgi:hypothetical protein
MFITMNGTFLASSALKYTMPAHMKMAANKIHSAQFNIVVILIIIIMNFVELDR